MIVREDYVRNSILGAIVGDAMGVPYEWKSGSELRRGKIKGWMTQDNRRNLPVGAWLDDSSMILCTIESLNETGTNMVEIAKNYLEWYDNNHWTAIGRIFDMGSSTRSALENIRDGYYINGFGEMDKGNGSLMRVLPLAMYLHKEDIDNIKETVENFSSLTHSTLECRIACVFYSLLVKNMTNPECHFEYTAITKTIDDIQYLYSPQELKPFENIISRKAIVASPEELNGSGYVVHSLEVVVNCLFNSCNFSEAIIRAISIGEDTDTNASLVGGIVGMTRSIPKDWVEDLQKREEIFELLNKIEWGK